MPYGYEKMCKKTSGFGMIWGMPWTSCGPTAGHQVGRFRKGKPMAKLYRFWRHSVPLHCQRLVQGYEIIPFCGKSILTQHPRIGHENRSKHQHVRVKHLFFEFCLQI